MSDRTPYTFYGALHYLYRNLIKRYPDAFIFVITPLHSKIENNLRQLNLGDYVKRICDVADVYSLPVLDLYANSGICPAIPEHEEKYTVDSLHPNDLGHKILSERIIQFIRNRVK